MTGVVTAFIIIALSAAIGFAAVALSTIRHGWPGLVPLIESWFKAIGGGMERVLYGSTTTPKAIEQKPFMTPAQLAEAERVAGWSDETMRINGENQAIVEYNRAHPEQFTPLIDHATGLPKPGGRSVETVHKGWTGNVAAVRTVEHPDCDDCDWVELRAFGQLKPIGRTRIRACEKHGGENDDDTSM